MHRRLTVTCVFVADVGPEGRGLVATRRVGGGESLLRIPRSLVLTSQDATQLSPLSAAAQRAGLPQRAGNVPRGCEITGRFRVGRICCNAATYLRLCP